MRVVLANPRGFCAGVDRAIEIVERALQRSGGPIYVRHEIVHNHYVVDDLRSKGAVFGARSGDKGGNANVGIWARSASVSAPAGNISRNFFVAAIASCHRRSLTNWRRDRRSARRGR